MDSVQLREVFQFVLPWAFFCPPKKELIQVTSVFDALLPRRVWNFLLRAGRRRWSFMATRMMMQSWRGTCSSLRCLTMSNAMIWFKIEIFTTSPLYPYAPYVVSCLLLFILMLLVLKKTMADSGPGRMMSCYWRHINWIWRMILHLEGLWVQNCACILAMTRIGEVALLPGLLLEGGMNLW